MSEPDKEPESIQPGPSQGGGFGEQGISVVLSVPVLTILTGVVFPLVLGLLARGAFARQAQGSLLLQEGVVVGSELIGQPFHQPWYFHPRHSAVGYEASASGATNLGPNNRKLRDGEDAFAGVRQLVEKYRRINGLAADAPVPIDAVTRSGSGLDPHISPANAALQAPRIARERGLSEQAVRTLVAAHTHGRQFGFLGAPRVCVLSLNLALDRVAPLPCPRPNPGSSR